MKIKFLPLLILVFILLNLSGLSAQLPFVTKWVTDDGSITIPTTGEGYNYEIAWENLDGPERGTDSGVNGDYTISNLPNNDTIQVEISGDFPRIYFSGKVSEKDKIVDIAQWGDIEWSSFQNAFNGCSNLQMSATDIPDLRVVTDLGNMFNGASSFNGSIGSWDVSNVMDMEGMFNEASSFNQDLNSWDVSNVTTMQAMFKHATAFNGNIASWNVGNVVDMLEMFEWANNFNQDISSWNVANVTDMRAMFHDAFLFNADITGWDVSNVTNMFAMFANTAFSQDISVWDVSSVTSMGYMFYEASDFSFNLGSWDIGNVQEMVNMFDAATGTGMSCEAIGRTIKGWSDNPNAPSNITIGVLNRDYPSDVIGAINNLENTKNWTFNTFVGPCDPLPILLLSFTAQPLKGGFASVLFWETAWERNSSYFDVMRSEDGINWEKIGRVKAEGHKFDNSSYKFIDENPLPKNYYRLKGVDYDGQLTLSAIRLVEHGISGDMDVSVFPNPSEGSFSIKAKKGTEYTIYSSKGQIIGKGAISENANISSEIELLGVAPGVYYIQISNKTVQLILQ